ncbi:MAG: hypothetical protein AAF652_01585 [Cyanobacteria bacterium P01_C01_bin.72]
MTSCLTPRYNLDDDLSWLLSVDPLRRYWIAVNGNKEFALGISGLLADKSQIFQDIVLQFRALTPGQTLRFPTYNEPTQIYCVSSNCYAILGQVTGAEVWHLFDHETMESLLMTAHPDWIPSPGDIERSRELLSKSWEQSLVA